jgi:choline dehydrogenase-like flavoprotein
MIVDARSQNGSGPLRFDVCIIGAGPAGIAIAWELRNSGLSVGLLESGGFVPDSSTQALYGGRNVGHAYFDLDNCRARYFGGSTNWWVAMARPLDDVDFVARDWVPHSGWPFAKAVLDPFYRRAEQLLMLPTMAYEGLPSVGPGREALPLPPGVFEPVFFTYGTKTLWHATYRDAFVGHPEITLVLRANVLELELNEDCRAVTRATVGTLAGNRFGVEAKLFVLATGGLENPRLLLASQGRMACGIGNGQDLVGRFFMEHPNVAIGRFTAADPGYRSVLYSRHQTPEGLIQGALVPTREVQGRERLLNTSVAFERPGFTLRDFFEVMPNGMGKWIDRARLAARKRALLYRLVGRVEQGLLAMSLWQQASDIRNRVPGLRMHTVPPSDGSRPSGWSYRIYSRSEQEPNPQSRVTLGSDRDAFGMPRLVLNWSLTELDLRTLRWTRDMLSRLLSGAGTFMAYSDERIDETIKGGWHHMGTTRMARDPKRGVVDENCRVHGIENLYVAGSSVFPTGGYANPTLTIVALASRLSDHLKEKLARHPSVGSAPGSSIGL